MRYILCTEMYHCTPEELRKVPLRDILLDLNIRATIQQVAQAR